MIKVKYGVNDLETFCIKNNREDLLQEWDYEKNKDLVPENIGFGSERKVWWICKYKHEWLVCPGYRTKNKTGCPYCSGQKILAGFNDLATKFPEIAKEWNVEKNGELEPSMMSPFSNKKVWWKCKNAHEWEMVVSSRTSRNYGCPYCSKKRIITGEYDMQTLYPEIAKEWHPTKNMGLEPCEFAPKSNKKVWWRCSKGHEWYASINNRTNLKRGCPECGKNKMGKNLRKSLLNKSGSLADNYPEIAKEWHPTKNGNLTPNDIMAGSNIKIWWRGACGHEWEAYVGNRTLKRSGCPYCSGFKVVTGDTDLQTRYPEIADDWNYEKNGNLKPTDVTASSNKRVWWKCKKCGHEWDTTVGNRTSLGRGCPICSKVLQSVTYRENRISKVGSLADTNPELAKEWHPIKNGLVTPENVSAGCSDKVWWLLPYDDPKTGKHFDFEWEASIASRSAGVGCPFLAGRCWSGFNDITVTHIGIMKYWDNSRNTIDPKTITKGSHNKVWWICNYGHSFKSDVSTQCRKFSCPICNKEKQTSFPEQAIFYYIRQIFPDAINGERNVLKGMELDIYIPSQKVGIEYDGSAWHKKIEKDIKKELRCKDLGIRLFRVREDDCEDYESKAYKSYVYKYGDWKALDKILIMICEDLSDISIDISIDRDTHAIEKMFFSNKQNNSVASTNPELMTLWHPTKNSGLSLNQFNRGSAKFAWWKDAFGHEYKCRISSMTRGGEHCPYCLNHKLLVGFNDLQTKYPNVAEEWDNEKNGSITPSDVIYNSGKYWFTCKNCGNRWEAYLANRTRKNNPTGCPVCGNRRAVELKKKINSLADRYPELAREWNFEKNGMIEITDKCVKMKSKVWWKCSKGHEWRTSIEKRAYRGDRCPYCNRTKQTRMVQNVDTGEVFQSVTSAAKSVGLSSTAGVTLCCQGKYNISGGYHWRYVNNIKDSTCL